MASYLKKYATALISAKDYVAQWSADHVYSDEALIVPFPTVAIHDPEKQIWTIFVKAWVYLPFEGKKLKSYLPSLSTFLPGKTNAEKVENSNNEDSQKIDKTKQKTAAVATEENRESGNESNVDDDVYEDALEGLGEPNENPGRLSLFFVGNSVRAATKSIINGVEHLFQPSDESGFIEEQVEITEEDMNILCKRLHPESDDRHFNYEIQINEGKLGAKTDKIQSFQCTIYVLASYGVSIISDIDDTIKVTKVLSKRSLLKNTFYNYFQPVDGMSELYQKWSEQKCQFHYVSASPWQLFPALRCFLEKYKYPIGTMNLRKFSWSFKFLKPPDTYKIEIIERLIKAYPLRKYICVGDSGEFDPEIYAQLYENFPENIAHVFIRDICHTDECLPTCSDRYLKVFENVPNARWTVFKDPQHLETNIEKLINVKQ